MGVHPNITADKFPKQGDLNGRVVLMVFHADVEKVVEGLCIRHDVESPNVIVIKVDDGRVVLGTECTFQQKLNQGVVVLPGAANSI